MPGRGSARRRCKTRTATRLPRVLRRSQGRANRHGAIASPARVTHVSSLGASLVSANLRSVPVGIRPVVPSIGPMVKMWVKNLLCRKRDRFRRPRARKACMIEEPPSQTAAKATAAKKSRRPQASDAKPSRTGTRSRRRPNTTADERPGRRNSAAGFRRSGAQYGAPRRGKRQGVCRLYAARSKPASCIRTSPKASAMSCGRLVRWPNAGCPIPPRPSRRRSALSTNFLGSLVEHAAALVRRAGAGRGARRSRRQALRRSRMAAQPDLRFPASGLWDHDQLGDRHGRATRTGSTSRHATRLPSMSGRSPARSRPPISSRPIPNCCARPEGRMAKISCAACTCSPRISRPARATCESARATHRNSSSASIWRRRQARSFSATI